MEAEDGDVKDAEGSEDTDGAMDEDGLTATARDIGSDTGVIVDKSDVEDDDEEDEVNDCWTEDGKSDRQLSTPIETSGPPVMTTAATPILATPVLAVFIMDFIGIHSLEGDLSPLTLQNHNGNENRNNKRIILLILFYNML